MGYVMNLACPACGAGHGIGVYDDGGQHNGTCMKCKENFWNIDINDPDFAVHNQSAQPAAKSWGEQETVEQIKALPCIGVPERQWSQAAAQFFGLRVAIGPTGKATALYYPYFHKVTGEHLAYKKRRLDVPKSEAFSVLGEIKECGLFGSQKFRNTEGGKKIVVVEGEDDVGSAFDMYQRLQAPTMVVGLITGAGIDKSGKGLIDKGNKAELPWLSQYPLVQLALDQDAAGQATSVAIAEELVAHTTVKFMSFSEKDPRDLSKADKLGEWLTADKSANIFVPYNLVKGTDISMEDMTKPLQEGFDLPFPKLNRMLRGLRAGPTGGELTLLAAGANMGKTTLCREIQAHFCKNPLVFQGCIYLEESHTKTAQGFIAAHFNVPLPELRLNPNRLTPEQWTEAKAATVDKMMFHKHFGSMSSDKLINEMIYLVNREGRNLIVFDHISLLVSGQEESKSGERKDIDVLMTKLATFVTVTGCHVIAVVQLKRRAGGGRKDKEGHLDPDTAPYNRGGRISIDDLRGSGSFEHLAHNIFVLEGNDSPEDGVDPNTRWLRCLKNREWGVKGIADYLQYSPQTGRLMTKMGG